MPLRTPLRSSLPSPLRSLLLSLTLIVIVALPASAVELVHYGYSGHGDRWREYVAQKAEEFETLHPDVTIQILEESAYVDGYLVMSAGDLAPDISEFNARDGGQLQAQGLFLDLNPYLERMFDNDVFLPISLRAFTWSDGSVWGFPVDSGPNVTLFNRDLFEQYGLASPDEHPDQWTWKYASEVAQVLTRDVNGDGEFDQWGIADTARMWAQSTTVRQAGGWLFDRAVNPTESRFNSPEVLRGLEFLVDLNERGVVAPSASFVAGQVGFNVTASPGAIPNWFGTNRAEDPWDWGMALPLQGPANRGTLIFTDGFQISRESEHPELAMEWILFLMGTVDASDEFVRLTGRISANRNSLPVLGETLGLTNQMLDVISETMIDPESYPNYTGAGVNEIRGLYRSQINSRVFQGGESPRNVLLDLHQQVAAILEQARAE